MLNAKVRGGYVVMRRVLFSLSVGRIRACWVYLALNGEQSLN